MRIDGDRDPAPLEDGDALGRRMTAGAGGADDVGGFGFPRFFFIVTDEAAAAGVHFEGA